MLKIGFVFTRKKISKKRADKMSVMENSNYQPSIELNLKMNVRVFDCESITPKF